MILIVDRTSGYWRGWVHDDTYDVPISGATVNLLLPGFQTRHYFATTTSYPNGYWSFEEHKGDYVLEVINGSESVTIEGDAVHVEVPEHRRQKVVRPGHPWFWPRWAKRT